MKKSFFILFDLCSLISCKDEKTDCPPADRIGAICKDGTSSTATGSGACSSHGGVDHWICK